MLNAKGLTLAREIPAALLISTELSRVEMLNANQAER
jgi:hypothetical protein